MRRNEFAAGLRVLLPPLLLLLQMNAIVVVAICCPSVQPAVYRKTNRQLAARTVR